MATVLSDKDTGTPVGVLPWHATDETRLLSAHAFRPSSTYSDSNEDQFRHGGSGVSRALEESSTMGGEAMVMARKRMEELKRKAMRMKMLKVRMRRPTLRLSSTSHVPPGRGSC